MQTSYELDEYAGRPYFLSIRGEPDLEDPDEFAVTLYYKDPETESTVDVAQIDTSHGYVHLDKLYSETEDKEPLDVGIWEAVEYLTAQHPEYARKHRSRTDR